MPVVDMVIEDLIVYICVCIMSNHHKFTNFRHVEINLMTLTLNTYQLMQLVVVTNISPKKSQVRILGAFLFSPNNIVNVKILKLLFK